VAVPSASDEPTLDQLFAEPIVRQLMRRDGIDEETTRRLFKTLPGHATAAGRHGRGLVESKTRRGFAMGDMRISPDAFGSPGARDIVDWLVGDECRELDLSGLTAGFGARLRTAGLPLDRLALHMRTLHPLIRGRTIAWAPNEPVEFFDVEHGGDTSSLVKNPIYHVASTHQWLSLRLEDRRIEWSTPYFFLGRNLVELVIAPLCTEGPLMTSAVSFGTSLATGFAPAQRSLLQAVVPALRSASELKLLRADETTLLATYVGTVAAQRILAGHKRRGDVETLEAALMVCDLRGFTVLSNNLPEERVLELLNIYFDQVVSAIADAGGEILKFMGDAVLAYFRHENGAAASCAAAFGAARIALAQLAAASKNAGSDLHAGVALHYGKASYGNVGSGKRLDFTVIGRDVNLVSRIQSICALTGQPLLMSERFADLLAAPHIVSIGHRELKGFGEPAELFGSTIIDDRRSSALGGYWGGGRQNGNLAVTGGDASAASEARP
jgi:adenylate cyclase